MNVSTYLLLDVANHGPTPDLYPILLHWVDHPVQDLALDGLERDGIEPHVEDHVASGVLHDALEIGVVKVQVICHDVDDVAKFFGALANKLLIYPKMIDFILVKRCQ